eukprot:TRINITY_DN5352_c0_g1_i2.p1 TRINITY_DN5352_c0_g1~~TRINITY_DN5352_c0_g1_i2.p1  ORF type:complete len:325 (-),score=62.20 TRINITY_DN5352_c0_g1_i2:108-1082(-)
MCIRDRVSTQSTWDIIIPERNSALMKQETASSKKTFASNFKKDSTSPPGFLLKTFDIVEQNRYPDIVAWNTEGDSIWVKDSERFSREILPNYFKHSNYTSFVRQLNMYGFKKSKTKQNYDCFCHIFFKKGSRDLLILIKRRQSANACAAAQPTIPQNMSLDQNAKFLLCSEILNLKKLNAELANRNTWLETQIEEMKNQVQGLNSQYGSAKKSEGALKSLMTKLEKKFGKEYLAQLLQEDPTIANQIQNDFSAIQMQRIASHNEESAMMGYQGMGNDIFFSDCLEKRRRADTSDLFDIDDFFANGKRCFGESDSDFMSLESSNL